MKNKIILILVISSFLITSFVLAAGSAKKTFNAGLEATGIESGQAQVKPSGMTLPEYIGVGINALLTFLGVIFLALMIYGGYKWMMARGNDQEVEIAKKTIQNAVIGLIIIVASYAVVAYITGEFGFLAKTTLKK